MVAPLGNNWSTLINEHCPSSYILQNFRRRKRPVSADVYVNCITKLLVFSSAAKKKIVKWHVYFSLLVQEQTVLLCSLEIPLFSSCDLTCLNLFEFILPKEKKIQAKFDFIILRWINHKTPPFSLSLKQGAIINKYRKSDIFNTKYLFSCYLSFSNHNDKISLLSS